MTLLILGVALWWAAHLFKRVAPDARARMGDRGKGLVALGLLVSVVLMVIGYRMADGAVYWGRSPMLVGINNLLMLAAFTLFAADGMKTRLGQWMRHPQLTGFSLFAFAHLLVNGDVPSFILFGGLLAWARAEIVVINAQDGAWQRPDPLPAASTDIKALGGGFVVMAAVMGIHYWLGYQPWG